MSRHLWYANLRNHKVTILKPSISSSSQKWSFTYLLLCPSIIVSTKLRLVRIDICIPRTTTRSSRNYILQFQKMCMKKLASSTNTEWNRILQNSVRKLHYSIQKWTSQTVELWYEIARKRFQLWAINLKYFKTTSCCNKISETDFRLWIE